ncbi:MAG: helix-turn-helix domain-containing protein [Bacilli bacterium]|nr:helix-turn-helix domain-containing protein [Bacilli bacterium]
MDNLATVVGKNIAALRKAKGLTQSDLARQVNYSDKSISKWELGYAVPSVDILMDLASFFGVTIDYLVKEHSQESIDAAAEKSEKAGNINNAIVIALSMTVVVLIAMSVFFAAFFFTPESLPWSTFIWMIPAGVFVALVESHFLYGEKRWAIILGSAFVWTLLLSFCFQFTFFNEDRQNIFFILIIGIPIQIIVLLAPRLRRSK